MKSIRYIAVSLGAAALMLTSCNDFLDQEPDERTHIDTEVKVEQLLIASYPTANYGWIGEISSDNFMDNNAPHLPISSTAEQIPTRYNLGSYGRQDDELFRFEHCVSSDQQDTPSYLWQSFYSSIFSTNEALEAIDAIAAKSGMTERLRRCRGEALLLCAYCHFILVNVFSQAYKDPEASKADVGVPYVDKSSTDFTKKYDRENVAVTYQKIEADLEEGLKYVSDAGYDAPKYHFNVNAAHAFAARFYLFCRKYDKVIEHANFVLDTNRSLLPQKLIDFSGMDNCTYMSDYVQIYESPDSPNNLFLLNTMSLMARHGLGYRYAHNSLCVREVYYHQTPFNGLYAYPFIYVGGWTFWTGNDYGYFSAKAGEEFEYTDKLAGIGFPHTVRREFTNNMLLLERAEAEIMTGKYEDATLDLIAYNHSLQSFSEANMQTFAGGYGMRDLRQSDIDGYFSNPDNYNCFADWDFTQRMSSSFIVPKEAVKYMNCLNEFRRIETCWDGTRFFDLKRFGIEYSHIYGPESEEIKLTWDDPRRAIEVPDDAIMAGLEPSRPTTKIEKGSEFVLRPFADFLREEESYKNK